LYARAGLAIAVLLFFIGRLQGDILDLDVAAAHVQVFANRQYSRLLLDFSEQWKFFPINAYGIAHFVPGLGVTWERSVAVVEFHHWFNCLFFLGAAVATSWPNAMKETSIVEAEDEA